MKTSIQSRVLLSSLSMVALVAIVSGQSAQAGQAASQGKGTKDKDPIASCLDRKDKRLSKSEREAAKFQCRAELAARVLLEATWDSHAIDKKLPIKMMDVADCIIVLPRVRSGGFIFGGTWGHGVYSCIQSDGLFGDPHFISVKNGKWMVGLEATQSDYIMIVDGKDAQRKLEKGQIEVGAEGAAVLGPWGRKGRISTNFKTTLFTYSKSKGLALGAGFSLGGLRLDKKANEKLQDSRVARGLEVFTEAVRSMR